MAEVSKLISGYKNFYKKNFIEGNGEIVKDLLSSQSPKTLIIGCCDSRVDPAILTSAEMGDIFVIRNVANIVPPYEPMWDSHHGTSAAIEYAVNNLNVNNIVVFGHSNCGGINALVNNDNSNNQFSFIKDWLKIADEVKKDIPDNLTESEVCTLCEKRGIKISLNNLLTFPWIKDKVEAGSLNLHGWYFTIKDGSLLSYDNESNSFKAV